MKKLLILALVAFSPLEVSANCGAHQDSWSEVVEAPEGRYSLSYDSNANRVDVASLGAATAPAAVRIRIRRGNECPLDLRLKTLDLPSEPLRYSGSFPEWNGSRIGFELQLSFDGKTWKKVKRFVGARGR